LLLRSVENLFSKTILRDLGQIQADKGGQSQAQVLFDFLVKIGLKIKMKFLADSSKDPLGSLQTKSFGGKEGWKLLEYFEEFHEVAHPVALREDPVFNKAVTGYLQCWSHFKEVMRLLVSDFKSDCTIEEKIAEKEERANAIEIAGKKYVDIAML
jgi:hypothetical protein